MEVVGRHRISDIIFQYLRLSLSIIAADYLLTLLRNNKDAMEYLSKERYDEITAELNNLITVVYPKVKDDLSEARAQGDLSENCGYRAARSAQAKTISRIRFLQRVLEHSRVIDVKQLPKDRVVLLSRVDFTNLATGAGMSYTMVSPHEMNLEEGKISIKSPIGQALMGKKVGDIAVVNAPAGTMELRIDRISLEDGNNP